MSYLCHRADRPTVPAGVPQRLGQKNMHCHDLASRIEQIQPDALPRDVARLCLLLSNYIDDFDALGHEEVLAQAWQDMGMRLQAATDQHAAMTQDLEQLSQSDPQQFTPEDIWILIRALKVQSQVLQLYAGDAE